MVTALWILLTALALTGAQYAVLHAVETTLDFIGRTR